MIFYFTGTRNSLFAARQLLMDGEKLINIAEAMKKREYRYTLSEGETLGFVFPVYFYTVPAIIAEFVDKLCVENVIYTYAVITCGGGISQAGAVLKKILGAKSIQLDYVKSLLMPDNAMLYYNIPIAEDGRERIENAKILLSEIRRDIESRKELEIGSGTIVSSLIGGIYSISKGTKKFWVMADKCNGCGLCEKNCPESAICLQEKKPIWVKHECSKCTACINRCPQKAIQYGKMTVNRNRYELPKDYM